MDYILKRSGSDTIAAKTNGENSDAVVRLRGLPFTCTKEEIATFFLGMLFYLNTCQTTLHNLTCWSYRRNSHILYSHFFSE